MPEVSVIIPVYNHDQFIEEAIQSVLIQTFQDFEIIIINDASTDNTSIEIAKFNDPRIKVYNLEKNSGISFSMNYGINHSIGKYIAHLNADDVFLPEKLKKQIDFLKENPNFAAVFTNVEVITESGDLFSDESHFYHNIFNQPNRNKYEWLNYFFYKGNCLCHPSVIIHRKCLEECGFYDLRFHCMQDVETWVRLVKKYDIHIIQEKLTKFRVFNKGNSTKELAGQIMYVWEFTKILEHYLDISVEQLEKIFPDIRKLYNPLDKALGPYYIADLALKVNSPIHNHFALETLYNVFNDKEKIKTLIDTYNINSQEFIRLTGNLDIFNTISHNLLQQKTHEIDIKDRVIMENNSIIQEKEKIIRTVLNSASWKLTNPLRWFHSSFLHLFNLLISNYKKMTLSSYRSKPN